MKSQIIFLFLLTASVAQLSAQNLVPNPSFEEYDVCPPSTSINTLGEPRIDDYIKFWEDADSQPFGASSDFFHTCAETYNSNIGPATGNGHLGAFTYTSNGYREYVQVPLKTPLCNGRSYEVKMKLASSRAARRNTDRIGVYFSNGRFTPPDADAVTLTTQVETPPGQFINNETRWREFTMNFTNTGGGEDHLTIGNFRTNANTNSQGNTNAYIYIDDVSVVDITPVLTIAGGTINNTTCGNSNGTITGVSVSGGSGSYSYEWIDADGNVVSTDLNPSGLPIGVYELIVDDNGSCTQIEDRIFTIDDDCPEPCPTVNLARNPGFEENRRCPNQRSLNRNDLGRNVRDWYSPNDGMPSLFHYCNPSAPYMYNVPSAYPGQGLLGFYTYYYGEDRKEYIQSMLESPMVAGERYTVRFEIRSRTDRDYATDQMGVYFSNGQVTNFSSDGELGVIPQLKTPAGTYFTNSDSWQTVSFAAPYVATGGEDHVTIGKFENVANTTFQDVDPTRGSAEAFYFIDNVVIEPETNPAGNVNAGADLTITSGVSTTLMATPSAGSPTYSWTASPADASLNGQESQQDPSVSPTVTTTYTVSADFGGGCTAIDAVTITINASCTETVDAGLDQSINSGDSTTLTAIPSSGSPTYSWTASPADASLTDTTSQNPEISPIVTTTYTVTADFGGCTDTDTIVVTVNISNLGTCPTTGVSTIQSSYNWYFGDRAGISFANSPATPLNNGQTQNIDEGIASISDNDGNLLFYTSGERIYDNNHSIMNNGTGLLASPSSTQGSVIVKIPESTSEYYIFQLAGQTGDGNFTQGFAYSIVDVAQNQVTQKNISISNQRHQEKLTAIQHCNGVDVWIIVLTQDGDFSTYLLTANGLSLQNTYPSNMGASSGQNAVGQLKANIAGNLIAHVGMLGDIEVASFDSATGAITLLYDLSVTNPQVTYGLEFSPDSSKLYVSKFGGSAILRFDLSSANATIIQNSETILFSSSEPLGSLQLGPDQNIYFALRDSNRLGIIGSPNLSTPNFTYTSAFGANRYSRIGLPNILASSLIQVPEIDETISCQDIELILNGNLPSDVIGVNWDFGDGNSASGAAINHTYAADGNYTVTAFLERACGGTYCQTIDVVTNCNCPLILNDTNITIAEANCNQSDGGISGLTLSGNSGNETYVWADVMGNTVGTALELTGVGPGDYSLTVIDGANCSVTGGPYNVGEQLSIRITGGSVTDAACGMADGSVTGITLDNASGAQTYQWSDANGMVVGTESELLNVGLGSYSLTVTDLGCSDTETFNVQEVGLPDLDTTNVTLTDDDCSGNGNGSITGIAFIGTATGATYSWTDASGLEVSTLGLDLTGMGEGSYTLTVRDALNCGAVAGPYIVNMEQGPMLGGGFVTNPSCTGGDGSITNITTNDMGNMAYSWSDVSGTIIGTDLALTNIGAGAYTLTVTENGCSATIGPFELIAPQDCQGPNTGGDVRIANIITPNGDGANDTFIIEGLTNYPNSMLHIYNRWGSKLYQARAYDNSWDGTFEGSPLPVGTYYYILELNNTGKKIMKGTVTILR